ncbi:caspase family protein [Frigidibacter sp. ROC022]|uniref:caspase family protein n=1 Tax=Frigidibacter sp. ROC022 TaxID=2971796 RepID=UPI00215A91C9|nr:caspase family protein [Frigidibacter sp. ROC022]MCR8724199.1 caspase family protein [Frigidibacter sp. ROC022]
MRFRNRLLSTVLPLALGAASPALAEVRALLVGVSDYHSLDADLKGPQNDVGLLADALLARGADPALIRVLTTPGARLAQGLAPAADPTRAAILAALDDLAAKAGPGDTVIFYYSGHGSQAPDQNGDEAGGYDEILLPSDSTGWRGAIGAVENAIVDDELQVKMQAILDTGAELVAILDACHSATGFRAVGGLGEARYVSPQSLGIPEDGAGSDGGHIAPPLVGDFVFLYSSQSDERSFEYPIGDKDDPANWYGDFTRNLTAVLTSVPDLTWAQALAAAADGLKQELASQTPDGEGALDRPVFGAAGATEGRMRIEGGRLMAGMLSGLAEGATVEIFDAAAGGASLGIATLKDVQAAEAALDFDGALPATAYAELRAPGRPAPLRLAPPVAADDGDYSEALAMVAHIKDADLVDGLVWTEDDYDMRLVLVDGEIAIVGRDGVLDPEGPGSSPRIKVTDGQDVILGFLDRAVRLERLQAALSAAEGRKRGLSLPGTGLKVEAERLEAAKDGAECGEPDGLSMKLKDRGAVSDCDQVWLALKNNSRTAQDVTVLYVDRDMHVVPIWPQDGLSNRVAFGETVDVGLQIEAAGLPGGVEQIIVIAVPARDGAPRTVLTGLADAGQMREVGAAPGSATEDWLLAAADPEGQSRAVGPGAKPDPVKVTRIRVVLTAD